MQEQITLNVLDLQGFDYPGNPTPVNIVCNGNKAKFSPGYVIYQETPEPNYHFTGDGQEVQEAIAQGWLWYPATRVVDCDNNVFIVSDYIKQVEALANACCPGTIETQVFTFMRSSYPIVFDPGGNPDQVPPAPCGAKLEIIFLAIFGQNETRNLTRTFEVHMGSDPGFDNMHFELVPPGTPFTQTVQQSYTWPDDFIGLQDSGGERTLIANDAPKTNEDQLRVRDFDGGTIQATLVTIDVDTQTLGPTATTWRARVPQSECREVPPVELYDFDPGTETGLIHVEREQFEDRCDLSGQNVEIVDSDGNVHAEATIHTLGKVSPSDRDYTVEFSNMVPANPVLPSPVFINALGTYQHAAIPVVSANLATRLVRIAGDETANPLLQVNQRILVLDSTGEKWQNRGPAGTGPEECWFEVQAITFDNVNNLTEIQLIQGTVVVFGAASNAANIRPLG